MFLIKTFSKLIKNSDAQRLTLSNKYESTLSLSQEFHLYLYMV